MSSGVKIAKRITRALQIGDAKAMATELENCFYAADQGNLNAVAVARKMLLPHVQGNREQLRTLARRHMLVARSFRLETLPAEVRPAALRLLCEAAARLFPAQH